VLESFSTESPNHDYESTIQVVFGPSTDLRALRDGSILARVANIYLDLTGQFNRGRLRAIISSGQAVVLHRLAIMSKDGDWILREDSETMHHVLAVLAEHGARYRFGAPLDQRWMEGGWSAHFEFRQGQLRVRTDFVTRPARIEAASLRQLWQEIQPDRPVVGPAVLAEIKKTNREKDYAVIGELARLLRDPSEQLLYSRSARDLLALGHAHPDLVEKLSTQRPLLRNIAAGQTQLEEALDAERRSLIRANEKRLARYREAAQRWATAWPEVEKETRELTLFAAHEVVVARALEFLPLAA
jgi:hypothetical protein